jgi:adenine-specific DNA-methyltransferase
MYNRLKVAKELLTQDGIICVTIDDFELPRLWLLLEDVFKKENHLGTVVIRNNPKGRMTTRKFSLIHEYAVFYGKSESAFIKKLPVKVEEKSHNYIKDDNGNWYLPINLRKQGVDSNAVNKKGKLSDRYFPIYLDPKSNRLSVTEKLEIEILPIDGNGIKRIWRRGKDDIEKMFSEKELYAKETKNGYQLYFKFRGGLDGQLAQSIWYDSKFSASEYGTRILDELLGEREVFSYPKSPDAIKQTILATVGNENAIILDFFGGSGTTAHAVLELNKEDGGNRQFILCEQMDYIETVTSKRVKKVIENNQQGSFIYLELKKYNQTFMEQIEEANDTKALMQIWEQMKAKSFLNYNMDIKKQDEHLEDFKALSLAEQKQHLCELLDKNQLYVNLSSLNDADFACTEEEKKVTKDFYQINK